MPFQLRDYLPRTPYTEDWHEKKERQPRSPRTKKKKNEEKPENWEHCWRRKFVQRFSMINVRCKKKHQEQLLPRNTTTMYYVVRLQNDDSFGIPHLLRFSDNHHHQRPLIFVICVLSRHHQKLGKLQANYLFVPRDAEQLWFVNNTASKSAPLSAHLL